MKLADNFCEVELCSKFLVGIDGHVSDSGLKVDRPTTLGILKELGINVSEPFMNFVYLIFTRLSFILSDVALTPL